MSGPVIEHWLVAVARASGLVGEDLSVASDTPTPEAWTVVALAGGVEPREIARLVATHFRLPLADFQDRSAHAERIIPATVARRLGVLPLRQTDRTLAVASSDPVAMEAERELTALSGRTLQFEVAAPQTIRAAIDETYSEMEEERHELPRLLPEEQGGPLVLVVDDDPDARLLLRHALEERGFRVHEAEDGTEALELLAGGDPFTLVTLDLQMRELHGLDTLRRIRGSLRTAHLPVIVATGASDPEVEMELFGAGADDYVVKPIDPPRFVLRVQAVLRRRGGGLSPYLA